jgi:hypothetical protein
MLLKFIPNWRNIRCVISVGILNITRLAILITY